MHTMWKGLLLRLQWDRTACDTRAIIAHLMGLVVLSLTVLKMSSYLSYQDNTGLQHSATKLFDINATYPDSEFFNKTQFLLTPPENLESWEQGDIREGSILIYAKYRTGSTFSSRFLALHPDVYYIFEPLVYLTKIFPRDAFNARIIPYLKECLRCRFDTLQKMGIGPDLVEYDDYAYYGVYWEWQYNMFCDNPFVLRRWNVTGWQCAHKPSALHEAMCQGQSRIAIKVIRATRLQQLWPLTERDGVQIIHVIRDPRAVIGSRLVVEATELNKTKLLLSQALQLHKDSMLHEAMLYCKALTDDISFSTSYTKANRSDNRYTVLRYEDMAWDPSGETSRLHAFLNLRHDETFTRVLRSQRSTPWHHERIFQIIRSDPWRTSQAWRFRLPWVFVNQIQDICSDAMRMARYNRFLHAGQMKNKSVSSLL